MGFFYNKKISSMLIVILIASIFIWISIINIFPDGYVVSAADHAFFFDMKSAAQSFLYTWTNALGYGSGREFQLQASLLYQYLLVFISFFKLPNNIFQTLFISIFTFLASVSFYASLRILFSEEKKNKVLQVFFSLLYGLNGYTLFLFMHVFGYYYQQIFYIFVPVVLALSYKIIEGNFFKKYISIFFVVSFLCSMAFNNPGFLVALNIVLALMLFFFIFSDFKKCAHYIKRYLLIVGVLFITNIFWLFPFSASMIDQSSNLTSSVSGWDIVSWLKWQSTDFINIFRFMSINSVGHFPDNSMLASELKILFGFLSFLPILLIFWGLLQKQDKYKKQRLFFLIFFIFLILAIAKIYGPLPTLVIKFFSLPIINATRSVDKFMIFLPFVVFVLIYIFIISSNKINKKIKWALIFILLIFPLPFYTGKLQQNVSIVFKSGENYKTAQYSYLVKVPEDYFQAAKIINNISRYNFKVQYLPYGVINSPGWSQYPKWKFIGNDLTANIFDKPVQKPSTYLNGLSFNYGQLFNSYSNPEWIMRLFGLMNDAYLVFNKDVDDQFLKMSSEKISFLENSGNIKPIFKKEFINLYEIDKKYFLPLFYVPKDIIYSEIDYNQFPDLLSIKAFNPRSLYILGNNEESKNFFERKISTSETILEKDGNNEEIINLFDNVKISLIDSIQEEIISVLKKKSNLKVPDLIFFHKVNPTKYVINIKKARGNFPLIFSESYNKKWISYAIKKPSDKNIGIFTPNESDLLSANIAEINNHKDAGNLDYYGSNYISKNIQGTIQNDNIPSGNFYDTYFLSEKLYEIPKENHFMANGYSNGWLIDINEICKNKKKCIQNPDGSYDIEMIVEFWPQRLFYLGLFISSFSLISFLGYLGWGSIKSRKENKVEL